MNMFWKTCFSSHEAAVRLSKELLNLPKKRPLDIFARPCKVSGQNCLNWNFPKVLQKVPFHWEYSLLSLLRAGLYFKGDCKNNNPSHMSEFL